MDFSEGGLSGKNVLKSVSTRRRFSIGAYGSILTETKLLLVYYKSIVYCKKWSSWPPGSDKNTIFPAKSELLVFVQLLAICYFTVFPHDLTSFTKANLTIK